MWVSLIVRLMEKSCYSTGSTRMKKSNGLKTEVETPRHTVQWARGAAWFLGDRRQYFVDKRGNSGQKKRWSWSLSVWKKRNKSRMPEGYIAFSGEGSNSIQPKMREVQKRGRGHSKLNGTLLWCMSHWQVLWGHGRPLFCSMPFLSPTDVCTSHPAETTGNFQGLLGPSEHPEWWERSCNLTW